MKINYLLYIFLFTSYLSVTAQSKVIAHRGFWNAENAYENTLASLKHAEQIDIYGSECDIYLTADNVLLLHHNDSVQGLSMSSSTSTELRKLILRNNETLPTLEECLQQVLLYPRTKLIIEIKPRPDHDLENRTAAATVNLVNRLQVQEMVEYISFSLNICKEDTPIDTKATIAYLSGDKKTALSPKEILANGFSGMDYHYQLYIEHPEWVNECKALQLSTNVWTVDKPEQIEQMKKLGVDYITTNCPLTAKEILAND